MNSRMHMHMGIYEGRRRIEMTIIAPTTEHIQQSTTPLIETNDWINIRYAEKVMPRMPVDRAVLQPLTTPSSTSNSAASFINTMLIPVFIAVLVLLIAVCFALFLFLRARRQRSAQLCGLRRQNAWRRQRSAPLCGLRRQNALRVQEQNDDLEDILNPPQHRSAHLSHDDKPPPYSECTNPSKTTWKSPPPYSACYDANTHLKDTEPKVHIRPQNVPCDRIHSNTNIDNTQNELIENGRRRGDDNINN